MFRFILFTSMFFLLSLTILLGSKIKNNPTPAKTIMMDAILFKVSEVENPIRIRLIALKHSKEKMADDDARMAVNAIQKASGKGLDIKAVGDHNINKEGKIQFASLDYGDLPQLQAFVSEQMKISAQPGDTVIVFTIGHGHPSGSLDSLGQREGVMRALAGAAGENKQRTLWWQLSCYASAHLPKIESLSEEQQELFSILATSNSTTPSPAYLEGKIMEKVFVAMADRSKAVDPNGDNVITAQEFRDHLNTVRSGRGNLLYARRMDLPIFGGSFGNLPNLIPIVDHNGSPGRFPKDFIPLPSGN